MSITDRDPGALFGEYVRDVGFRLELSARQVDWIVARSAGRNMPLTLDDFQSLMARGLVVNRAKAIGTELTVAGLKVAELLRYSGFGEAVFHAEHLEGA